MALTLLICGAPGVGKTHAILSSIPSCIGNLCVIPGANIATPVDLCDLTPLLDRLTTRMGPISWVKSIRSLSMTIDKLPFSEIVLRAYHYVEGTRALSAVRDDAEMTLPMCPAIHNYNTFQRVLANTRGQAATIEGMTEAELLITHNAILRTLRFNPPSDIFGRYPDSYWLRMHETCYLSQHHLRSNYIIIDSFETFSSAGQLTTGGIDIAPIAEIEASGSYFGPETCLVASCRLPLSLSKLVIGGTQGGVFCMSRNSVLVVWPFDRQSAWIYTGNNALTIVLTSFFLAHNLYNAWYNYTDLASRQNAVNNALSLLPVGVIPAGATQDRDISLVAVVNDIIRTNGLGVQTVAFSEIEATLTNGEQIAQRQGAHLEGLAGITSAIAGMGVTAYQQNRITSMRALAVSRVINGIAQAVSRRQIGASIARQLATQVLSARTDEAIRLITEQLLRSGVAPEVLQGYNTCENEPY